MCFDIMHCKIAFFTICLDLRLLYFAHLSALLMSSVFSLFLHRTKFQVFLFFWNIISPPVLCIFPTKGALLWCDFTHGRTHGRMHNYLTILPNTPHHHKNIHIHFWEKLHIVQISNLYSYMRKRQDLLTWVLWKTPFDIDLKKKRISSIIGTNLLNAYESLLKSIFANWSWRWVWLDWIMIIQTYVSSQFVAKYQSWY